jgi:SAM-dependent methyltransferase
MTQERPPFATNADAQERYTGRGNRASEAFHARRTAAEQAAFLLPYLRPGMRLLDCGCGPGSITCDLAEVVAPGEVIGLDLQPSQVERAAALARERGVVNVRFEVGSIYTLPFPDASFDATFARTVLMHLQDPLAAAREMRRVLKPGGIIGLEDGDWGIDFYSPLTPALEAMQALRIRVHQYNGGNPFYARHQRHLLLEAGFTRSEASARFMLNGAGSLAKTRQIATQFIAQLRAPAFVATATKHGWASRADLDAMVAELTAWSERPDAMFLRGLCAAVGWNEE